MVSINMKLETERIFKRPARRSATGLVVTIPSKLVKEYGIEERDEVEVILLNKTGKKIEKRSNAFGRDKKN